MQVELLLFGKMPLAVGAPFVTQTRIIRRVILSKRSEKVKEIKSSLAEKKHLSFANLDLRLVSRDRKSPFVVLSSWVRCFVIIRVTMPYTGSTLSDKRNVMITRKAFNCGVRNYPLR